MLLSLIAGFVIAAPATPPETCEILAEVGRGHHQLDQRMAPPLRPSINFTPVCDWAAYGLRGFATAEERPNAWFIFGRPQVDGDRATVTTAIVHGPRSGHGSHCSLNRRNGRWQLERCRRRWVS